MSPFRSWCTWHGSDGTCVVHRPCEVCGAVPVLIGRRPLCSRHAHWNAVEKVWEDPQEIAAEPRA